MKTKEIKLNEGEGAIVFRDGGVEFYYPRSGPLDIRETFEFLTFAMMKTEWMTEWYEYLAASEALRDLAGEPKKPNLTLLIGGKEDESPQP
jgi:hypothetical protein